MPIFLAMRGGGRPEWMGPGWQAMVAVVAAALAGRSGGVRVLEREGGRGGGKGFGKRGEGGKRWGNEEARGEGVAA